jgi:hypothetical protein
LFGTPHLEERTAMERNANRNVRVWRGATGNGEWRGDVRRPVQQGSTCSRATGVRGGLSRAEVARCSNTPRSSHRIDAISLCPTAK